MVTHYQKCVKDITTEKGGKSKNHTKQSLAAVIHFAFPIHTYSIKYMELNEIIKLLILLDGKEKVEKELKAKFNF